MNHELQTKKSLTLQLQKKRRPYPLQNLPRRFRQVAEQLHFSTQVPVELIASIILAVFSVVCQYITAVKLPHSGNAQPLSLYLLTIAESGEGKSFILKLIIGPVLECLSRMNNEYQSGVKEYRQHHRIWRTQQQALEASFRQAVKRGYDGETEARALEEHNRKEPQKPVRPKFIYEDVSPKALIQGLSLHSSAGIITDEGISFMKGMLKNHLALLNKGWDSGTYDFQRADGESYEFKICLMILLMVQPEVFQSYLNKHGEIAKSSGFFARFLMTQVDSNIGNRFRSIDAQTLEMILEPLHTPLRKLLGLLRQRFYDEELPRDVFELSEEAKNMLHDKRIEMEGKVIPGGEFAHIRDFVSKFPDNSIRMAAIFSKVIFEATDPICSGMLGKGKIIDGQCMRDAMDIMEWYMEQSCAIFYPISERCKFESDVLELHSWIANALIVKADKENGLVCISDVLQRGPNRLRKREVMEPVLHQLVNQRAIFLVRNRSGGSVYILPCNNIMQVVPRRFSHLFPSGYISISLSNDIPAKPDVILPSIMPQFIE